MSNSRKLIADACDLMKEFLLEKNDSYGDSAFNPLRIMATSDAKEQIRVRIDDKLNRIRNRKTYSGDNDLKDVTGYFILLFALETLDET